ncbi:MAG: Eco57I restriction-modification methylase domain-containing protein [Flavobacterium sp.]
MLKDIEIEKPHRAHQDILAELGKHQSEKFEELYRYWQKVLNTKALNKNFFKKIANWYFLSVAYSKFPFEYLKSDPKHQNKSKEQLQEIANQKATIRFITRMIFVWFLKEKGLISNDLFDRNKVSKILKNFNKKTTSNYYNAILQNLFFATLNKSKEHREFALNKSFHENKANHDVNSLYRYETMFQDENPDNIMKLFENIPFLNGGLFDSLDNKENKEIIDGFSRNKKWQANMPDFLFFEEEELDFDEELRKIYGTKKEKYDVKGLFEIFREYKFTIEENTPTETDVALDPYLLGEIFENLLAYYNPETGTTARKGSGSFYTPQEIVNYMVDESLKAYLDTKIPFEYKEIDGLHNPQKTELVKALSEVKILDPACGSGAFPMGVLYKMVDMLKHIDPDNSIWKKIQHDKIIGDKVAELEADKKAIEGLSDKQVKEKAIKAVEDRLNELETIFNNEYNFDDYARKLYIIQNCIYGVDIQDVAIQISKLRFFLSLIVDQKNEDIKPLPNLETKFVIANTLIGIDLPKFTVMGEDDHSQDTTKALKEELKNVREHHFKAVTRKDKLAIKEKDKAIREKIANSLADSMNSYKKEDVEKLNEEITAQKRLLAEAELMPDMVQEIIVKDLFGGESTSKVNYRKERIKEALAQIRILQNKIDSLQANTQAEQIRIQALKIAQWDIYNQSATADWFDMDWMFGIQDGFDIIIGNPPYVVTAKGDFKNYEWEGDLYYLFFEFALKKALKNNGILSYITPKFYLTNLNAEKIRHYILNEVTIINLLETNPFENVVSENLITNIKNNKSNLSVIEIFKFENKTFFKFNDVKIDYCRSNLNYEIITFLNDVEIQLLDKIKSENKPLKKIISESKRGAEIGKKDLRETIKGSKIIIGQDLNKYEINLTESKIDYNHKEFKRLSKIFNSTNIVYLRRVSADLIASTSNLPLPFSKNLYGILPINSVNKFYLCSLLNSKCLNFYYKKRFSTKKEDVFPEIQTYLFEQLPIKEIPLTSQQPFISVVNQILEGKKHGNDTSALEHQIDVMVYHLYELSYEEACIIDATLKEEDFERYQLNL